MNDKLRPGISIEPVHDRRTRAAWLSLPYQIYRDDPAWISPLKLVEERRFKPVHPFYSFADVSLFVAFRGGEAVGRISAQVNKRHLAAHNDATGHFGFFDCVDDPEVAKALVDAAASWLRERGMTRMVGPLNYSTNEESGLLVDGFDTPPALLMTHARPWFGPQLEQAGLTKVTDLYAYRMDPKNAPDQLVRLAQKAMESGRITVRLLDTKRLMAEIECLVDIFNDAWSQNWGFVPFDRLEIDAMAAELKPFLRPGYCRFILIDGAPAAVMLGLPDINGLTAGFNGNLLPFNWISLVARLALEDFRGARVPLLGIRREFQHTPLAAGVLAILVKEFLAEARKKKLDWVEFSWVLEGNRPMNTLGRLAAGAPDKTYRVYEKALSAA